MRKWITGRCGGTVTTTGGHSYLSSTFYGRRSDCVVNRSVEKHPLGRNDLMATTSGPFNTRGGYYERAPWAGRRRQGVADRASRAGCRGQGVASRVWWAGSSGQVVTGRVQGPGAPHSLHKAPRAAPLRPAPPHTAPPHTAPPHAGPCAKTPVRATPACGAARARILADWSHAFPRAVPAH